MNKIKLSTKLTIFTTIIIVTSISLVATFFSLWSIENQINTVSNSNMALARSFSYYDNLGNILEAGDPDSEILDYTISLTYELDTVDFIVFIDMEGNRVTHPVVDRIGGPVEAKDIDLVLEKGESYISKGEGSLGLSIRAMAPIYNSQGDQVGAVAVGTMMDKFLKMKEDTVINIFGYSIIGVLVGSAGAIFLSKDIKKSLYGLEPYEIGSMFREQNILLESIQEGIISIDRYGRIRTINNKAMEILEKKDKYNLVGEKIGDFYPDNKMEEVLESGIPIRSEEVLIEDKIVVLDARPVYDGEIIGVMATLIEKSEVEVLAEKITGYNELINTLRTNSHEFSNKLHIIVGLIEIGEYEEAKKYILETQLEQKHLIDYLGNRIKDPIIISLILGKLSKASEKEVELIIDERSSLSEIEDKNISVALITAIGNLVENSYEAVEKNKGRKKVKIYISETLGYIKLKVEDNGIGIKRENLDKLYLNGYSNKGGNRGLGLPLVKEKIDALGGEIHVKSTYKVGTTFKITIPKKER